MSTIHPFALTCIGFLGLLLFGLGFAVSGYRGKFNVLIGVTDDPDHTLNRLVRAHGNTAEYVPFLALLFLLVGSRSPQALALSLIGAATACRFAIVVGLLTAKRLAHPSVLRFLGATGTYVTGIWLSLVVVTAV